MSRLGIVLTGGGARAAYQVGVLRALYEILGKDKHLFSVVTGNSAGAINAAYLASHAHNWDVATRQLWDLWSGLAPHDVFDVGTVSLGQLGARWLTGTMFGGLSPEGTRVNHLLKTDPLRALLHKEIDFSELNQNIQNGELAGFALSTTNYYSGSSVVFYNASIPVEDWSRSDRFSVRTSIMAGHVMGSSAIPFFFPPEKIGESWYGDGCVRQTTPLSPAIHLGAEKIVAIGIRAPHPQEVMRQKALRPNHNPTIGTVAGSVMNAIFLDALESDVERLSRINHTVHTTNDTKLRAIPVLLLRPSQDLGAMTEKLNRQLPTTLRYLLKGIGVSGKEGLDLLSYLAFDKSYTRPLIELGHRDTLNRSQEIERFICA